jgi:uncharacterized linocin/CFP29 family protein
MNHLLREHAPLTADTWAFLDAEATTRLSPVLGARKLVDFAGPLGWEHSATSLGRVGPAVQPLVDGVVGRARAVLTLTEVRADFSLSRDALDDVTRGAVDIDLSALDEAASRVARLENIALFDGWRDAGIQGVADASSHEPISDGPDAGGITRRVAAAVATLKRSGIGGPYGLAVDYGDWAAVVGGNDAGGSPLLQHLERILDGRVELVPGISSPTVLSLRGGDYLFESGQDLALGYSFHDATTVGFYLEESFSFRVATPEAAVTLA